MARSILLMVVVLIGCSHTRFVIDLGDLSDPVVQQQVASREDARQLFHVVIIRMTSVASHFQPMAEAVNKVEQIGHEQIVTCQAQGYLLEEMMNSLQSQLFLSSSDIELARTRIEKGGYRTKEEIQKILQDVLSDAKRLEEQRDSTKSRLSDFFVCMHIRLRIVDPSSKEVIFVTPDAQEVAPNRFQMY